MNPRIYTTLSTTVWIIPLGSGVYPTVSTNNTVAHKYQLQIQNDEVWRIYDNVGTMYKALKNPVINPTEDMYLNE